MKNIMKNKMKLLTTLLVFGMFIAVSLSGVMAKKPGEGPPPDPDNIPNDNDWNTWDSEGNMFALPEGNVGIGITNPIYGKLQVENDMYNFAIYANSTNNAGIIGVSNGVDKSGVMGVGNSLYSIGVRGHNYLGGIGIEGYSNGGWAGYFTGDIYASGNVGIGTQTPSFGKLHVEAIDNIAIYGYTNSGSAAVYGGSDSASSSAVYGHNPAGGIAISGYSNGGYAGYFTGDVYINGNLKIDSGIQLPIKKISADYTVLQSDYTIIADGSSASDFTITLPLAADSPGKIIIIRRTGPPISAEGCNVHIHPAGYGTATPDYLDGVGVALATTLTASYSLTFQSDGIIVWYLISQSPGLI